MATIRRSLVLFGAYLLAIGIFIWPTVGPALFGSPINAESEAVMVGAREALLGGLADFEYLKGKPAHLSIPDAGIALPITDGGLYPGSKQNWILAHAAVSYDVATTQPNNLSGTTFIYGHNNRNVLGNTSVLKEGAKLIITTENDIVFEYKLIGSVYVNPTDVNVLKEDGPTRVLLMTCSGNLSQQRRAMSFEFVKAGRI